MTITFTKDSIKFSNYQLKYLGNNEYQILNNSDSTLGTLDIGSSSSLKSFGSTAATGYTSAGNTAPPSPFNGIASNVIDKFPFASGGNATDVGDITLARWGSCGQSSDVSGYTAGGFLPPYTNKLDKFPFSTDSNATDVGSSGLNKRWSASQSSSTNGYQAGGLTQTASIVKFPFATDSNGSGVGSLTVSRHSCAGQSSTLYGYGYTAGGTSPDVNTIDKFPFASDANATDVGDLTSVVRNNCGQSSLTSGYSSLGFPTGAGTMKFPFATDSNATSVGGLSTRFFAAGISSANHGYASGGEAANPGAPLNIIDRFPFSSESNAEDVGDLTVSREGVAGQQG